jgi:L,D-peptidoglycan transpeptidase YkuD (ErfK/YbiS/YcfS/YnhG family)
MADSTDHLIVKPDRAEPTRGRVFFDGRVFDCALGRSGVTTNKREGDGATPAGCYTLRRVLYRPDRGDAPETALPVTAITETDGWCDDPDDANYNRPVTLPYAARAERMWRDDSLYDVVVVLGHNDDPVVAGAGSAIFLHVAAPDFGATEGCVALRDNEVRDVLRRCSAATEIDIRSLKET